MKTLIKAVSAFFLGIGIGALMEACISIILRENIVGVPGFVASVAPGYAKIIQCICYGGFGLVSFLCDDLFKRWKGSFYLEQGLRFLAILLYFFFIGSYLQWFAGIGASLLSLAFFIVIYAVIWIAIYFYEKRLVEKMNEKLR